jgi:probable rRNA maturation factor
VRVRISNQQKDLPIPTRLIKRIAMEVVALEIKRAASTNVYSEVGLHFITTRAMCRLHDRYFDDPSTTDCISFPVDSTQCEERLLGDVFVCPKTAIDYATLHDIDPQQELILYVIHGLLHLLGYDDIHPKERVKMRAAERRHLRHLNALGI